MSRCPAKCTECLSEVKAESRAWRLVSKCIRACTLGPAPTLVEEDDDDSEDTPTPASGLEEDDRIFAATLHPLAEEVCATGTTSQRLTEAFRKNQQASEGPTGFHEHLPEHLHQFEDVFSKESFDMLPDHRPWDHAIELKPGSDLKGCKVYPISLSEQVELDAFIQENLVSSRIRQLKSPMASPVFFIKKKDGALQLVQDYWALNTLTVKNKYPLPLISEIVAQL